MLLNTVDPGLKIAGVTRRWESKSFQILWTPDRGIQGQAKSGLKIAGVTKRWESKSFCP